METFCTPHSGYPLMMQICLLFRAAQDVPKVPFNSYASLCPAIVRLPLVCTARMTAAEVPDKDV